MAEHAITLGWNRPVIGRESMATEMFTSWVSFLQEQVNADLIESYEPVILSAHGGDMNGFVLVRGELDKLNQLKQNDKFQNLVTQSIYCCENFGVIDSFVGSGLTAMLERWTNIVNR